MAKFLALMYTYLNISINKNIVPDEIKGIEIHHSFPMTLFQLEEGISHLPLLDSSMRATPLAPSEWMSRLENKSDSTLKAENTDFILLDVRNGYEWDVGHLQRAHRPGVDFFRSTSSSLSDSEVKASDPLANINKEKTDILMYCIGGICCDVYSTILRLTLSMLFLPIIFLLAWLII